MWADELVLWVSIAVVAVVLVGMVSFLRAPRPMLAAAVGASGVLITAQVGNAHVFTIITFVWACFTSGRVVRWQGPALLLCATGLLATTTLFGGLVNSHTLALQLLALAASAALIAARSGPQDSRLMLRGALLIITVGAGVGLLQDLLRTALEERGAARQQAIRDAEDQLMRIAAAQHARTVVEG